MLREEREAFFQYRPGLLDDGGKGANGKAEHRWDRATLGQAWFLSPVSWFLGF